MEFLTNLYLPIYKKEDKREERELFIDFDNNNIFIHYKGVDKELYKVNENKNYNNIFDFIIYYINYILPKGEIIFFERDINGIYEFLKDNKYLNKTFKIIEGNLLLKTYINEDFNKKEGFSDKNVINVINNNGIANEKLLREINTDVDKVKSIEIKNSRENKFCNIWTEDCVFERKDNNTFNVETKKSTNIFAIERI